MAVVLKTFFIRARSWVRLLSDSSALYAVMANDARKARVMEMVMKKMVGPMMV